MPEMEGLIKAMHSDLVIRQNHMNRDLQSMVSKFEQGLSSVHSVSLQLTKLHNFEVLKTHNQAMASINTVHGHALPLSTASSSTSSTSVQSTTIPVSLPAVDTKKYRTIGLTCVSVLALWEEWTIGLRITDNKRGVPLREQVQDKSLNWFSNDRQGKFDKRKHVIFVIDFFVSKEMNASSLVADLDSVRTKYAWSMFQLNKRLMQICPMPRAEKSGVKAPPFSTELTFEQMKEALVRSAESSRS